MTQMLYKDLMLMHNALTQLTGNYPAKFAYACARNLRTLAPIAESIQKAARIPETETMEHITRMSRAMSEADLRAQFPHLDEVMSKVNNRAEEVLHGSEQVTLHMIDDSDLPNEIPVPIMMAILPMVKETA